VGPAGGLRVRCCVIGCRRTTGQQHREWVCGPHWRTVQPSIKLAYNRTKRRVRKVLKRKPGYSRYWEMPPGSRDRLRAVDMWARYESAWRACVNDAIEGAVGIA